MARKNLTVDFLNAIKAPAKGRVEYFDLKVRGLALRVSAPSARNPEGARSWYLVYRLPKTTSVQRIKLGFFGRGGLSLADARDKAEEERGKVSRGKDPMAERRASRAASNFGELCDRYLAEYAINKRDKGQRDKWAIERHFRPKLGPMKATAITFEDCTAIILKIRETAPVMSNRAHSALRKIFAWGIASRALPAGLENPARGIPTAKERPRQKVLTETELVSLWRALDAETAAMQTIFRLRFLTLARGREIGAMRGQDLRDELKGPSWLVPAEVMKADRPLLVPLCRQAVEALCGYTGKASIRDISRDVPDRLFAVADASLKASHLATVRLRATAGIDFRPHDVRRTGATTLGALGVPRLIVSHILGHAESGITGVVYELYDRIEERRAALQALADHYDRMIERHSKPGDVLPMAAKAG